MRLVLAVALVLAAMPAAPAAAQATTYIEGYVMSDAVTRAPISDVCVSLGLAVACTGASDARGYYRIDSIPVSNDLSWDIYFTKEGYRQERIGKFKVTGPTRIDALLFPGVTTCPGADPAVTVYLPNITKTLGGPDGWQTPFIVQNTSTTTVATLVIEFYRFSDGALVARRDRCALRPGNSYALVPNNEVDLPNDSQFAVVIRAYGTEVVAVVNQHAGSGDRAEAASYTGASRGHTSVFLPNITRRFFGFVTPFIIQNLGTATTTAAASFVSFDGTKTATVFRSIAPGRSQFIDPNSEPGLVDGTQYAVNVTASQPLSVVVNTHNDAPTVERPVVYSTNGLAEGSSPVLGPYAVKNVPGIGAGVSTIVIQNLGPNPTMPTLLFRPLGGGSAVLFAGPNLAPRTSWAFDPRFVNGDPSRGLCPAAGGPDCLPDGEYSFRAAAENDAIAAQVNVIGTTTASGYSGIYNGAPRVSMPNVLRTYGGTAGWTTPIYLRSETATSVTLSWYRFSDGSLVTTQTLTFAPGTSQRIDPRAVPGLADGTQYSVVASGNGGNIAAIVLELNFQGGDGAMIYEGFHR